MHPTKTQVLQMLDEIVETPEIRGLVAHCRCVGNTAGKIAEALNDAGQNLNVEKIYCLGYLHDYGKIRDPGIAHTIAGYHLLHKLGFADDYCNICLIHHHINNDPNCVPCTLPDPEKEQLLIDTIKTHEFTLEDKLICFCDNICLFYPTTIEKRLIDCISRHGVCSGTQSRIQATIKFKKELDEMLGFNVYELFPEIKSKIFDSCWEDWE